MTIITCFSIGPNYGFTHYSIIALARPVLLPKKPSTFLIDYKTLAEGSLSLSIAFGDLDTHFALVYAELAEVLSERVLRW